MEVLFGVPFFLPVYYNTYIDDQYSQTYRLQPGIVDQSHIDGWRKVSDAVHQDGAKVIMQIQHSGALSQGNYYHKGSIAPSAIQPKGQQLDFYFGSGPYAVPREISEAQIKQIIQAFVLAAKNAETAGFDGVEIHGANGYLLDQFLTNYTNKRTDQYGGNTINRVRLLTEVIAAVKANISADFVVGIRISQAKVNDYFHKWENEEEAHTIFTALANAGVDYLHITEFDVSKPAFLPEVYKTRNHYTLVGIAKASTNLPIFANGQIGSKDTALEMFRVGDADILAIGKAALANHDFPLKIANGIMPSTFDAEATLRPTAELKDFEWL